jgi:5-methylcytosine-specific restriction enzyme subunit McrC
VPTSPAGNTSAPALLLSLEKLFERYVTLGVQEVIDHGVQVQRGHLIAGPLHVLIRPDIVIEREGRAAVVVDAKWKRLPAEGLILDDLYQLLAYCTILGARRGVLVYPGRRRPWQHLFEPSGVHIEVRTLDVAGPLERCLEIRRKLGRVLNRV